MLPTMKRKPCLLGVANTLHTGGESEKQRHVWQQVQVQSPIWVSPTVVQKDEQQIPPTNVLWPAATCIAYISLQVTRVQEVDPP